MMLSIIVPVFNVEAYLCQCIESIISQTFEDWELILVDDGSQDKSAEICELYSHKDPRIKVIHKPNGGVSSARNRGLDEAKGKWVTFIDADDFVNPTFLEGLFKATLDHENIDYVVGGFATWYDGKVLCFNQKYENIVESNHVRLIEDTSGFICSKLFRLSIINSYPNRPLRFDCRIRIAEDMVFTLDYLLMVEKYAFTSEAGYCYRKDNSDSATTKCSIDYQEQLYCWRRESQAYRNYINKYHIEDQAKSSTSTLGNVLFCTILSLHSRSFRNRIISLRHDFSTDDWHLLKFSNYSNRYYKAIKYLLVKKQYVFTSLLFTCKNLLLLLIGVIRVKNK